MSVANYVATAFPPAFISSGNGDHLGPRALTLAGRLEALGVEVEGFLLPAGL